MLSKIFTFFSNAKALSFLNLTLLLVSIFFNVYFQVFCVPTTWTLVLLSICFISLVLFPFLETTKYAPVASFVNGISVFVFLYCIIFLEIMNVYGIFLIFIGFGIFVYVPHFFLIQLLWKNLIKPKHSKSRKAFLLAIAVCTALVISIGFVYRNAAQDVQAFEASGFTTLKKNYMTEKILGMHFIYHTRFCPYDGWRPPKHEPILVIGMWLNKRYDPLSVDLQTRLELYKSFFPERKFKFDCSCGMTESQSYHSDPLWK